MQLSRRLFTAAWLDVLRHLPHRVLADVLLEITEERDDSIVFLECVRCTTV